jgi:hypothetical protein
MTSESGGAVTVYETPPTRGKLYFDAVASSLAIVLAVGLARSLEGDNLASVVGLGTLLAIGVVLFVVWRNLGRDLRVLRSPRPLLRFDVHGLESIAGRIRWDDVDHIELVHSEKRSHVLFLLRAGVQPGAANHSGVWSREAELTPIGLRVDGVWGQVWDEPGFLGSFYPGRIEERERDSFGWFGR